jgi:hypothetical protein
MDGESFLPAAILIINGEKVFGLKSCNFIKNKISTAWVFHYHVVFPFFFFFCCYFPPMVRLTKTYIWARLSMLIIIALRGLRRLGILLLDSNKLVMLASY